MPRRRGYCLGMNRDEKRTRAKGLPPAIRNIDDRRVLYPSEPTGGTWIALNDKGVSFALVNWYSVPAKAEGNVLSRGAIIPRFGGANSPALADAGLADLPLNRFNPFRLIGIFPVIREIVEWRWDLKQLTRNCHVWRTQQWISSGFDERMAQQVRGRTFCRANNQESVGTVAWLRRLHRSHSPRSGPFSTCMHRDDATTVSYTEIIVSTESLKMRHVSGPPCGLSKLDDCRALSVSIPLRGLVQPC